MQGIYYKDCRKSKGGKGELKVSQRLDFQNLGSYRVVHSLRS